MEQGYSTTSKVSSFTPQGYTVSGLIEEIRAYKAEIDTAIEADATLLNGQTPEEFRVPNRRAISQVQPTC